MMTIEEAIKCCRAKVESIKVYLYALHLLENLTSSQRAFKIDCEKRAEEHEQLAEWLEELQRLRETNLYLERRLKHLLTSDFIRSFDEVNPTTKEYKRDISEADCLEELIVLRKAYGLACVRLAICEVGDVETEEVKNYFVNKAKEMLQNGRN